MRRGVSPFTVTLASAATRPADSLAPTQTDLTPAGRGLLHRLRGRALWVILGRGLGIVANVLTGALLARLLTPEDVGAYVMAMNVIMFGGSIGAVGLGGAVVRFISEHLARGDRAGAARVVVLALTVAAVASLMMSGGLFLALRLGLASNIHLPTAIGLSILVSVAAALLALQQLSAEALRGYHELRFASFLSGGGNGGPLASLVFLSLTIAAASFVQVGIDLTLGLVVGGLVVSLPLTLLLLRRAARYDASQALAPSAPAMRFDELLRVCVPMLVLQLLAFVTLWADLWAASAWFSPDDVALYGFARRLAALVTLPSQLAMLTVLSSIPHLHAQGRLADLQRMLRGAALLAAIPSVAAAALLIIAPGPVLGLYYAPFYRAAATPLAIMAGGQILVMLSGIAGYTLLMTGRHNAALLVNLGTATVMLIAAPIAAARFGMAGLACVAAMGAVLQAGCEWLLARRLLGVWTHVGLGFLRGQSLRELIAGGWLNSAGEPKEPVRDDGEAQP